MGGGTLVVVLLALIVVVVHAQNKNEQIPGPATPAAWPAVRPAV
jgi:hypothetical protein